MLFLDEVGALLGDVALDQRRCVVSRMAEDTEWVVSAVARSEAEISLCRLGFEREASWEPWVRLRDDGEGCLVVPVDPACLERAIEIGCQFDVRTLDAVHLAAADRLPRPVVMLTFDRLQAAAARSMDLAVEGA